MRSWPRRTTHRWHSIRESPAGRESPGIVVFRWEAPLFFANASAFRTQVRKLVKARQPTWVVVHCEAVTDVDVTAAQMLEQLDTELNDIGVHLAFVEMRSRLRDLVSRYGLYETLDRDRFYSGVDEAIRAIEPGPSPAPPDPSAREPPTSGVVSARRRRYPAWSPTSPGCRTNETRS